MDGMWYLLAVIGIWVVVWWCWCNDQAAPDGPTHGLLAMKTESQDQPRPRRRR